MAGGGFKVTYSDMDAGMAAYVQEAQALTQALAAFKPAADLPASAFGKVSGSATLAQEYAKLVKQVEDDVTAMSRQLAAGGVKIGVAGAHYQAADEASTVRRA